METLIIIKLLFTTLQETNSYRTNQPTYKYHNQENELYTQRDHDKLI